MTRTDALDDIADAILDLPNTALDDIIAALRSDSLADLTTTQLADHIAFRCCR